MVALSAALLTGSLAAPVPPVAPMDSPAVLVFGGGGGVWSNGTAALRTGGDLSWACPLLDGSGLALVDEKAGELLAWSPGAAVARARVSLSRLSVPVSCVQHGAYVYVACFGVEGQPGSSGIAAVHAASWTLTKERPLGVHVHSLHVHRPSGRCVTPHHGANCHGAAYLGSACTCTTHHAPRTTHQAPSTTHSSPPTHHAARLAAVSS